MDRSEKIGLGVAVVGHVLLFGALSLGFLGAPELPKKIEQQPIDVSLVPDVALEATAPQSVETPAESVAPDEGAPEDAAPPAPEEAEPEPQLDPVPPAPQPKPAPPKPAPKPQPAPEPKPQPKPKPAPPKPVAKPAPVPKPVVKPQPKAEKAPPAKAAPAKSAPTKAAAKPSAAPAKTSSSASSAKPAKPSSTKGSGSTAEAKASRPRGSRLGDNFLKGLSADPSPSKSEAPKAAKLGAQAAANIGSAILRQVQPCANRQVTPGPGAERIRVTINLKLNRDGTLKSRPTISGHAGVDDDNRRYVDRVDDLAIATFVGCSPLRGLPDDLYDVQNGWSNFSLRYKLPG
ncbi:MULTISPECIES: cell envelope biogenesis protein TolA [unclassified Sphingomonas]|uniref:cell envelope biogenesis protein TolA n=1 Tax=unclassified Sphingomonas TaxID=196159 RepID=UPI000E724773|nr:MULTISPECIES: cell envelope biogenesis protein TolA [unclassified Sphingomonas]RKE43747.1 cell division and transport-associated protein TolA [Sphingomonas sp. PP-CC-1A-547]TCM05974.1 cell division and transport-associated protein TolA [Sphingomonas sp. PP-CC-3G-468]